MIDPINNDLMKFEESLIFRLRSLYKGYGYLPYKMNKFEEYDFYLNNKDFLTSTNVIAFNDTDGRLLAMKPDVTLSIIKNASEEQGCTTKYYYNENVYRVSPRTKSYREIMQTGLECVGDVGVYNMCEVLSLAAKSLGMISEDYVLDISHMGILAGVLAEVEADDAVKSSIVELVASKNVHDLEKLCEANGISNDVCNKIAALISIHGSMTSVLARLDKVGFAGEAANAVAELKEICGVLCAEDGADNIRLDFSLANDMSYYNGIVFKGFIKDLPDSVLSGGRYDRLLHKMGKSLGAIGFAVYLDVLEPLTGDGKEYDVDALLLYCDEDDCGKVIKAVEAAREAYGTVVAEKAIPQKLRYRVLLKMDKNGGVAPVGKE